MDLVSVLYWVWLGFDSDFDSISRHGPKKETSFAYINMALSALLPFGIASCLGIDGLGLGLVLGLPPPPLHSTPDQLSSEK